MTFSPALEEKFANLLTIYPKGRQRSAVVPMLLYAQDEIGHVSTELIEEIARRVVSSRCRWMKSLGITRCCIASRSASIHVQVCTNICCMLVGGQELYEHAERVLGIGNKQVTPDGLFSLEEVECIGACSWAPAIQINYGFHHKVTPERLDPIA